ncbi:damage-control phosphatase ARMT1-like isoform X3 [Eurosta solidaginis]|uniref:damage-control phosphatase ARMT1-like isoform X3 n=1 Tax=Eurosta solidaginis TaxID=178769 RepID=UPI003530F082
MSNVINKGTVAEFDAKYGILDLNTPPNTLMCGIYKQSFAYYTLRSRLPVTLTTIINNITRDKDDLVLEFGELNLWGNRCDLSITSGKEIHLDGKPFDLVRRYDNNILIDDSNLIVECLRTDNSKNSVVELICDNAGYELFTDLVLADYMIRSNLIDKVRFNLKAIPWFVSDTTINDFTWALQYLQNHSIPILREYGERWQKLLDENKFEIATIDHFWTSPYEYYRMCDINPDLYARLSEARLLIFKGDLNYRKLIGDFSWNFTESFITCLRGFLPTNVSSLRTVKADLICGLLEGQAESILSTNRNWMTTGDYGTIQFVNRSGISK